MDVLAYINGRSLLSTMTFYTASHFVSRVWYWAIVHSQHCCNSVFSIMANRKLCSTLSGTLTICGTQRNSSPCYGGTDLSNMRPGILFQKSQCYSEIWTNLRFLRWNQLEDRQQHWFRVHFYIGQVWILRSLPYANHFDSIQEPFVLLYPSNRFEEDSPVISSNREYQLFKCCFCWYSR